MLGYVPYEQAVLHNGAFPLPPEVGFTAIFSKHDEVVDWRACLDPQGDNREVSGQHVSLIVNREVYRILAQVLASCSR
jgi:triacylglycerol lipase